MKKIIDVNVERNFSFTLDFIKENIDFIKKHKFQVGLSNRNSLNIADFYSYVLEDREMGKGIEERIKKLQDQLGCKIGDLVNFS